MRRLFWIVPAALIGVTTVLAQREQAVPPPRLREAQIVGRVKAECDLDVGKDELAGTAVVRGRVTGDTGGPLEGVVVRTLPRDRFRTRTSSTDGEGRYELRRLPRMSLTIAVSLPGCAALKGGFEAQHSVTLDDGEVREGVDLVLVRVGAIAGRLSRLDGEAVAGAFVRAFPKRRMLSENQFNFFTGETDIGAQRPSEWFSRCAPNEQGPALFGRQGVTSLRQPTPFSFDTLPLHHGN